MTKEWKEKTKPVSPAVPFEGGEERTHAAAATLQGSRFPGKLPNSGFFTFSFGPPCMRGAGRGAAQLPFVTLLWAALVPYHLLFGFQLL